ncbi:hypothetical protein FRX31_019380 [Thalictrum thalictroides]|uniref:Uncharacterized protein n=1 Tax=Thalictrum thalictroides TaxID=46969 RepID=A0A7J6W3D2_THATH|nr:hypothetical protein FRX31_019380 [Thalictrum thalictroides]
MLRRLSWGASKAYKRNEFDRIIEILERDHEAAKDWLFKEPRKHWARSFFDHTSKCDAVTNNFSESFNAWMVKVRGDPLVQFVDKYSLSLVHMVYERRMASREMGEGLVPYVIHIIEKYCSPYYTIAAFKATYEGIIVPIENEEDWEKVLPEEQVLPPPRIVQSGRPKKLRIRDEDEPETGAGSRRCKKCKGTDHNARTCDRRKAGTLAQEKKAKRDARKAAKKANSGQTNVQEPSANGIGGGSKGGGRGSRGGGRGSRGGRSRGRGVQWWFGEGSVPATQ